MEFPRLYLRRPSYGAGCPETGASGWPLQIHRVKAFTDAEAAPVLTVKLQKFGNEKLGLALRAEGGYATITGHDLKKHFGDGKLIASLAVFTHIKHQKHQGISEGEFEPWWYAVNYEVCLANGLILGCPDTLSLLDTWNQTQFQSEQQVRTGDRIVAARTPGETSESGNTSGF